MVQWTKNMRPCWNFVHYAIWKPLPTSQSCCIKNLYNMFTQKSCILSFSPKDNNGILTNSVTWVASYLNGKKKKNQIIEIELDEISHTINTYIHTYLCIYVYIYIYIYIYTHTYNNLHLNHTHTNKREYIFTLNVYSKKRLFALP